MLDQLLSRNAVGWIRERDIDLLLCAELHGGGPLLPLLAGLAGVPAASLGGAWVSHMEADGESDLVVMLRSGNTSLLVLIENKIDAIFQPEQVERYQARAERWRALDGVDDVKTMIVAPRSYLARAEAQQFDIRLPYEDAASGLERADDRRSRFAGRVLREGIEAARRGYVMQPDQKATDIWAACWGLATQHAPDLRLAKPADKPGRSMWFYFKDAVGFDPPINKHTVVVYKAERGQVDLQFSATSPGELQLMTTDVLASDMSVVKAAKSASIRVAVEPVDFTQAPDTQQDALVQGLLASERMRAFFIAHRLLFQQLAVLGGR